MRSQRVIELLVVFFLIVSAEVVLKFVVMWTTTVDAEQEKLPREPFVCQGGV